MMDINIFREDKGHNPELIRESPRRCFADIDLVDQGIQLDKEWRQHQFELDNLRKDFNKINKEVSRLNISGEDASQKIKDTEDNKRLTVKKDTEVQEARVALHSKLEIIGNLVHDLVPVSNNEDDNVVVRTWKEKEKWTEKVLKNHVDLDELLELQT